MQFLTGGPVPRVRPSTGKPNPPLIVGEQRSFPYSFDVPPGSGAQRVRVRLLFRAVPPYFLRALAKTIQSQSLDPVRRTILSAAA